MLNIINFSAFYEEVKSHKLPLKTAYKLSNLSRAIEEKTEFYREKMQEIFKEYGELDENGNILPTEDGRGVRVKHGTEVECMSRINELQLLDVDLPDIFFTLEEFGNIELTLEIFNLITPFLKEE
jgi:hypothetical protein